MEFYNLLILQIIAHLLADFFLQTKTQAENKDKLGFKSPFLYWHILIVFSLSWFCSFQLNFIVGALVIALTHYIIDGLKSYLIKFHKIAPLVFFIDQILHLVIILMVVSAFSYFFNSRSLIDLDLQFKHLAIFTGFLLCLKPSNVFIKQVFIAFKIEVPDIDDLPNAGKLIGVLERLLVLTFIMFNQFEAVGFLLAAKSILRYKSDATLKTEYVLIGTMLSFGIAIITGLAISLF